MARERGFTLIELMIVVVIVAILAAIAYPSYVQHVRKSRRADATAALLQNAQFMERNYTTAGRYDKDNGGTAIATAQLPYQYTPESASSSANAYYTLTLDSVSSTAYTLKATPDNDQANDQCGALTVDNTNAKTCSKISNNTQCLQTCWAQ